MRYRTYVAIRVKIRQTVDGSATVFSIVFPVRNPVDRAPQA
jgi:hypothetical protein